MGAKTEKKSKPALARAAKRAPAAKRHAAAKPGKPLKQSKRSAPAKQPAAKPVKRPAKSKAALGKSKAALGKSKAAPGKAAKPVKPIESKAAAKPAPVAAKAKTVAVPRKTGSPPKPAGKPLSKPAAEPKAIAAPKAPPVVTPKAPPVVTPKAPPVVAPAAIKPVKAEAVAPKPEKPVVAVGKPELKLVEPERAIAKPAPRPVVMEKPALRKRTEFSVGDFVVYPTHGVGKIVAIEEQEIAGYRLELLVIDFYKEKMMLRVPVAKAGVTGMRRLSSPDTMRSALLTLKGRARIKRTMWSRRAQEYEAKINSGDPIAIAEVVRDLHRAVGQPEQSYSERQIYEAALERLSRELAAVEGLDDQAAAERLEKLLHAA